MRNSEDITLYERIGGETAVSKLVASFYARVFSDPELRGFFEDVSVEKLQSMQLAFFSAALDGDVQYTGRPLSTVHAGLGIKPAHLRLFLGHLLSTLDGTDLSEQDRYDIYSRIAMRADEITGSTAVDG